MIFFALAAMFWVGAAVALVLWPRPTIIALGVLLAVTFASYPFIRAWLRRQR